MFAKVIVDVPVIQVNRPFDYHVPENLQESIEVGMRVAVNGFRSSLVTRDDRAWSVFIEEGSCLPYSMLSNDASSDVEI